jgi:hypothetical protein
MGRIPWERRKSGDGGTILGGGPDYPYPLAYMTTDGVTVPTPVALDPAYPTAVQVTTSSGISADGQTMAGTGSPSLDPFFVPFVYRAPQPPTPSVLAASSVALISLRGDDRGRFGALGRC